MMDLKNHTERLYSSFKNLPLPIKGIGGTPHMKKFTTPVSLMVCVCLHVNNYHVGMISAVPPRVPRGGVLKIYPHLGRDPGVTPVVGEITSLLPMR